MPVGTPFPAFALGDGAGFDTRRAMHTTPLLLVMLLACAASGCSPERPAAEPDDGRNASAAQYRNELEAVTAIERDTRTAALENRMAALEAEVGLLKANPQSLDLELIDQRLTGIEARVLTDPTAGQAPTPPAPKVPPADARAADEAVRRALAAKRAAPPR